MQKRAYSDRHLILHVHPSFYILVVPTLHNVRPPSHILSVQTINQTYETSSNWGTNLELTTEQTHKRTNAPE